MPTKAGRPFLRMLLAAPFVVMRGYVGIRRRLERDRLHARRRGSGALCIAVLERIDTTKA